MKVFSTEQTRSSLRPRVQEQEGPGPVSWCGTQRRRRSAGVREEEEPPAVCLVTLRPRDVMSLSSDWPRAK